MRTKYKGGGLLCRFLSIAIAINSLDVPIRGGHSHSPVSSVKEAKQMKMGADNKKQQTCKRGISMSGSAEENVKEGGKGNRCTDVQYAAGCTLKAHERDNESPTS